MLIRPATTADREALWQILEPVIRAGETYAIERDLTEAQALDYWCGAPHDVFVAFDEGQVVGTYCIQPNQRGGGAHVANCGYMTHPNAQGKGVARAMCAHSLAEAKQRGFSAVQFNFVVSSNERAVRLWESFGFRIVGRLPEAFDHPRLGKVDVFVMFQSLGS